MPEEYKFMDKAFFFISWVTGNFFGKSDVRGGKKINKKRLLFIFLKKYSSMSMSEEK
jgi:hypothetical protein